jgi:hypothetical protein
MPLRPDFGALLLAVALAPVAAHSAVYDVGPGQPLAAIGDAPWATLAPGDVVRIHWRAQPYREKWVIGRAGTAAAPITVRGVLGPNGERPVIAGDGATTPDPLDYTGEQRGVLKIGTSNVPPDTLPAYVVIENLDVRSGHSAYSFTDDHGVAQTYANNAAAIYVERAQHLVIRNCVVSDSGNGLFVAAFDGDTQDILIEANRIYGNGNAGSLFEHNAYTAAIGIVYQGNRLGPLRAGANGNNLKDRSAGLVIRYNWIEGGNRELDLVDAEDSDVLVNHPSYRETFVYGNVLIEPDGAGNSQIVHYGGDSGVTAIYRKGILHFFHNTVVSLRGGNTTLLRLSTDEESADARNNILYVSAAGNRLAMLDADGALALSHNWTKPGWVASHSGLSGVISDDGTGVQGTAPGFVDAAVQNFHLLESSNAVDAGGSLHSDVVPEHDPVWQYREHQALDPRPDDGPPDLGAFELPEPSPIWSLVSGVLTVAALGRPARRPHGRAMQATGDRMPRSG